MRRKNPGATPPLGPYALLLGAQVAVGAAAIFARYALTGAGPLAVSAARLCIAALALGALAAVRPPPAPHPSAGNRPALAIAGLALAVHFATWIASLRYATVAVSTLLVVTTPLWSALYESLARRRAPSRAVFASFAAGAAGIAAVAGFDRTPPPVPGHALLGAALALTGGIAMAAYLAIVGRVRRELGTRTIVLRTYGWAAAALIVAAIAARQPPPPVANLTAWGGILAMALISQLLGHTAINASLRWFAPSTVAFTTLLEPAAAALLAAWAFAERLSPAAAGGALLLLAAVGVVLRDERGVSEATRLGRD